jgi:hypothetical protein
MNLIFVGIIKVLIKRKRYLAFQIIVAIRFLMPLAVNMKIHLDVINTRSPNPDKTLPYFIAIEHIFSVGCTLMVAF